jgi:hypothetical protein
VVTGTRAGQGSLRDEVLPIWSGCHANWVQKQPQGRHVRAEASGYAVHIDRPELVIELVREVARPLRANRSPQRAESDRPSAIRFSVFQDNGSKTESGWGRWDTVAATVQISEQVPVWNLLSGVRSDELPSLSAAET